MWSTRRRRKDSGSQRLPAGNAPPGSPSLRYTTTGRGLESGPPRGAETRPAGAGDERGGAPLPPCACARRRGYVTNARALERAAPVAAARGRRFPARRSARPRPRASPPAPPRPRRAGRRLPTLPEPAGQAAGAAAPAAAAAAAAAAAPAAAAVASVPTVRHSISRETRLGPARRGAARAPARGSRSSLSHSPVPSGPGGAFARTPNPGFELGRCPRRVLPAGDSTYWAGTARAALCALPRARCPSPTHSLSAEGRIAARAGSRAQIALAGLELLARVPASGADSAGIFKLSLVGLAERETRDTALGRKKGSGTYSRLSPPPKRRLGERLPVPRCFARWAWRGEGQASPSSGPGYSGGGSFWPSSDNLSSLPAMLASVFSVLCSGFSRKKRVPDLRSV
ncbi:putative gene 10518 [Cricetulus griseus]